MSYKINKRQYRFPQSKRIDVRDEGVNGTITVQEGEILDAIIETVNGDVTLTATPQNTGISLVNGNIKCDLQRRTVQN